MKGLKVTNYDLFFGIEINNKTLSVSGFVTICNPTDSTISEVTLKLYKDLVINHVKVEKEDVSFNQHQKLLESPNLYINEIKIKKDIKAQDELTLYLEYSGQLNGYQDVMRYVKDSITSEFSIIRPDCYAYPLVSSVRLDEVFHYSIKIKVPSLYTAASGGTLTSCETKNNDKIYHYEGDSYRFDVTIANYNHIVFNKDALEIYAFNKDTAFAKSRVRDEVKRTTRFFRKRFGKEQNAHSFTLIEIKEGYGSQAGEGYLLMEERGFKEGSGLTQLYHELGHRWNVYPDYETQSIRFFDEAFACYFEALALKEFYGMKAYLNKMNGYRQQFIEVTKRYPICYDTPMIDYGKEDLGQLSYLKGPWLLYVLHGILGDNHFFRMIKSLLKRYKTQKINFSSFIQLCQEFSKQPLDLFFKQWLYTTESSRYLCEDIPIEEMIINTKK